MKTIRWAGMLACMVWFSAPCAATETITVVADKWCPYNCGQEDEKQGYMVDIIRAALKKSDVDVVYKVMPWADAVSQTRRGDYDAVVGASRGDAPDFIFPEVLQGISINQFWVLKQSPWKYQGIGSLKDVRLGVVAGYSYGKLMDAYIAKSGGDGKIQVANDAYATEYNIRKLLSGELDVVLEDKNVIEYYFASKKMPLPIKAVGNPVSKENIDDTFIYIAFGPHNPRAAHYAELLTSGVKEMRKNGELQAILAGYNVDEAYHFSARRAVR